MKHVDVVRTAKIAVGCTLSFLMAEGLGLRYTNSVITITLLSILGTRLDTLRTAGKRFAAFGAALLVGALAFGVWPRARFRRWRSICFCIWGASWCSASGSG